MKIDEMIQYLRNYAKPLKIMEVCGTHTTAIAKSGLRELISPSIRLVSGPGCPVCITPSSYIDVLTAYAREKNHTVLSFGDLFKVRGTGESLSDVKAAGADVRMIYSPLETLTLAREHPERLYILAAVGFETTMPLYAVLVEELVRNGVGNVRLLTSLKTMLPALDYVCENETVDAFLCPGHVSVVLGSGAYGALCRKYQKPFVIAGFEPEHILCAIYRIVRQIEKQRPRVENLYTSVVSAEGQPEAQRLVSRYFTLSNAFWRGIGELKGSGMLLKEAFARFDLGSGDIAPDVPARGCRCGDVMLGRISPGQCGLFAAGCTPANPQGACMVSSEGACAVWYAAERGRLNGWENMTEQ